VPGVNDAGRHVTQLRCPNCETRLVEVERSDVLIDACPSCRGVWLGRGELDKILVRERQLSAQDPDDDFLREVGGRPTAAAPPPRQEEARAVSYDRGSSDRGHKRRKKRSFLEDLLDFD
jgi:hypothetical protein